MSADAARPQVGRIYDYVLGGTYNHEVDRRAAQVMVREMPAYPRWARQNRAFLAEVGRAESLAARCGDAGAAVVAPDHPLHQTEVFGAFAER